MNDLSLGERRKPKEEEEEEEEEGKKKKKTKWQIHRASKAHLQELIALGVSEVSGLS